MKSANFRSHLVLIFSIILFGCSNKGVNRADINQFVDVYYGKVVRTEPITFNSKADEAAAIGAMEGAIENSHGDFEDAFSGAIVGALFSSFVVSVEEGSKKGLIVDIETADKSSYSLTLRTRKIQHNDCLRIVRGNEVSFKIVSSKYCS
jgi:outer membrane lipoprotein SlyB